MSSPLHKSKQTDPALGASHFPARQYASIGEYFADYQTMLQQSLNTLDMEAFQSAADALDKAISNGKSVYVCGNGGSTAIANHWVCDFMKGLRTHTDLLPKIISLASNMELSFAIANDMEFAEVFVYPLSALAQKGDVLLTISSSGNSENIVRAIDWAKQNGVTSISLDGFAGGRAHTAADISLHIDAHNYGLVEDSHHAIMHMLAHYLRMKHMRPEQIPQVTF